jgi:hypothetical protein
MKPNNEVAYHARKVSPADKSGYIEFYDYHWGDCDPYCLGGKRHFTRMTSYNLHPDDDINGWIIGLGDVQEIRDLITDYRESKEYKQNG